MKKSYLNLILLFICQGLTGSIISLLTLTSTLVGNKLSPLNYLSTLPITTTVCGSAIMIYYASMLMERYGRKMAFIMGSIVGIVGSLFACFAIIYQSFILFLCSTFILGCSTVFNQYYRFAAAEIFDDELNKKKSISIIIGGGVFGGILGPFIAMKGAFLIPGYTFLGTFILTTIVSIVVIVIQSYVDFQVETKKEEKNRIYHTGYKAQNLTQLLKSNLFFLSTMSCAIGFSLMTLLMNATPLAMSQENFNIEDSAYVLQWHFVAMYAPALILPFFVDKLKTTKIILFGASFFIIGMFVAISIGSINGFLFSLFFVGLGWAFMFNGGTFLLNKFTKSEYKYKLQGINSLIVYLSNMIASLSIGIVMSQSRGWFILNTIGIVIIVIYIIIFSIKSKKLFR
ncbi:Major facilitator superfamily MFS_1 [Xenorhabdus poinarii G6]|uniref:Major facilitator superfamily MFS_1 n=1 Tax=Xenorhabdus poinarii G6 TaxID=1354304 RepID=A0A068QZ43_9GAMM|nr:MFS transporter [Xenorhabdus poinarii]CDG20282.1 Major facilitator superfamily MFS_1 [Xenorhabdus poinarii G6]